MQIRINDLYAHGWDLAAATGQEVAYPEAEIETAITFARDLLPRLPENGPFARPTEVPADASPILRLVALLGRPTQVSL